MSCCLTKLIIIIKKNKKTITCIGLQAEQILSLNIKYIYFFNLGWAFAVPFPCYFQKLILLVVKKIEIIFAALYFYLESSKSSISSILFQTGDINIFVLRGIFFCRYVQLKTSAVKSETLYSRSYRKLT